MISSESRTMLAGARRPSLITRRAIVVPLVLAGYEHNGKPQSDKPVWRHVIDDRIPLMSYVSLTGAAESLGRGPSRSNDWVAA